MHIYIYLIFDIVHDIIFAIFTAETLTINHKTKPNQTKTIKTIINQS